MTEKEVIMEVIGFFIVPGEREEDEQQHFEKILNFSLVSEREDERQYELKNKIERLEVLKQKMIEFKKPSFHHIAKIDRFIEYCSNNPKISKEKPESLENNKPVISMHPEAKEDVLSILKHYFNADQQNDFENIIETFGDVKNKLLFKGNSNKFADVFKKLFENGLITGGQKVDLINWIAMNFQFLHRNQVKDFNKKTLEQVISEKLNPCKKPIIEIKNGKVLKKDY